MNNLEQVLLVSTSDLLSESWSGGGGGGVGGGGRRSDPSGGFRAQFVRQDQIGQFGAV